MFWIRVGDQGDYQPVDDLDAVIDSLNEWQVGEVTGWVEGGIGVGLETTKCYGYDFISLFWGDDQANLIRPLDAEERAAVEASCGVPHVNKAEYADNKPLPQRKRTFTDGGKSKPTDVILDSTGANHDSNQGTIQADRRADYPGSRMARRRPDSG